MQMTCSQTTASTYERTQATASQGETAHLRPIDFSDSKSRCHIADGNIDTRCMGMNVKVRKTWNKDQVPWEKP